MHVKEGQVVALRDGRCIYVTNATDQDPEAYAVYSIDAYAENGSYIIKEQLPVETIFMGYQVHPELRSDPNLGEPGYEPRIIVSDMSEVVSIIE